MHALSNYHYKWLLLLQEEPENDSRPLSFMNKGFLLEQVHQKNN